MKKIFLLCFIIVFSSISYGQHTFHSSAYQDLNIKTDEQSEENTYYQIFSVSLTDKYLIHTVFGENNEDVTDSQIYRIIDVKEDEEDGFITITCKSGLTGNQYVYLYNFSDEEEPIFAKKVDKENFIYYIGKLTTFKTYIQEGKN
jgi:hypothetical protein